MWGRGQGQVLLCGEKARAKFYGVGERARARAKFYCVGRTKAKFYCVGRGNSQVLQRGGEPRAKAKFSCVERTKSKFLIGYVFQCGIPRGKESQYTVGKWPVSE